MIIKSDNRAVEKELVALESLLTQNGAWFHPSLQAVCENGSLSLSIDGPLSTGAPVIKMPQKLLVPAQELNVTLKGDTFSTDPDSTHVTPLQADIGKRMMELYNLTGKAAAHKKDYIWITYRDHPELLDTLMTARTINKHIQEKQSFLHKLPGTRSEDDFIGWSFLHTRVLGQKLQDSDKKQQVLMPIIDFLNHDHRGGPFGFRNDENGKAFMQIMNYQPFMESSECYVIYGFYDTLDTVISYGFPDVYAPYVRSCPVDVTIDGYGILRVKSLTGARHEKDLPQQVSDLRKFMPVPARQPDGTLEISHLIIPIINAPHALRRILQVLIRSFVGPAEQRKFVIDSVYKAEEKIVSANIDLYKRILADIEKSKAPENRKALIRTVATLQLNKLYKYMYDHTFFVTREEEQAPPAPEALPQDAVGAA